jgi:hypothetical protein
MFLRGMTIASSVLGGIIGVTVTVGTFAVSAAFAAAGWSKWLWNKMVDLGDSMLQDFLFASGTLSTIGGVRAFGAAFGRLPEDPGILPNIAQARGSVASRQSMALQLLGVKRAKDTADIAVYASLAAARFMKSQARGNELAMAEAFGLTALFSPQYLIALRNIDEKELAEMARLYESYKGQMKISDKAKQGWIEFSLIVKGMWAKIETVIANELANPNSDFTKAVSDLSKSLVHFFQVLVKAPITDAIIKKLGQYIDEFSQWLKRPETAKAIDEFIADLKDTVKHIIDAIRYLKQIIDMFRGTQHQYTGRRRLAERLGIDKGVRAISGPTFRPGVGPGPRGREQERQTRPFVSNVPRGPSGEMPKGGIRRYTGPAYPRIHAPPVRESSTGLRAPTKPSEAPETTEAATKGGFVRGSGIVDRSSIAKELQDKPWLRQRAMEIAANEEGTNQHGTQMIIESAMNRAQVRGTSLEKELRWTSEGGYYDDARGHGRAVATAASPQGKAILGRSFDNALGGSNLSEYATDNSSGDMAAREAASGKFKFIKKTPQGDYMFSPGSAESNLVPKYDRWLAKQKARTPGSVGGFTVQDIKEMDGPPTAQQPSTTTPAFAGDARLKTVGNYQLGGDQRRAALIQAAGEASKNLPPGWRIEAYSGQRNQGPHSSGGAVDFRLIDPQGHSLPNYQDPKYYGIYEKFAQDTHLVLQKTNPELAAQHRWGGYFSGGLGPGGTYGAMDLMHQDFAGGDSRMAAGQWKTGLHSEWARRWGVTESSSGIADRARSNAATSQLSPSSGKPSQELADDWKDVPLPYQTKTEIEIRHPIDHVKVHNHSDDDVSAAKTSSDQDNGELEPAEDLTK